MRQQVFRIALVALFSIAQLNVFAQNQRGVEMADLMRSEGKIYVVVGVLIMILIGFILYLISVDRKISKIEKGE